MAEQTVKFTPEKLVLEIPLNSPIEETIRRNTKLKLTNVNSTSKVIFRSKLNCKETYAIKPTCGIIQPNESIDIDVLFYKKNPQLEELNKKKHVIKFEIIIIDQNPNEQDPKKAFEEILKTHSSIDQITMVHIQLLPGTDAADIKKEPMKVKASEEANLQKKEQDKAEAQLNSLKAHLGDTNLKHDQMKNAQQTADASNSFTNKPSSSDQNTPQNGVNIQIVVVICFIALMIGYFLTS